MKKTLKQVLCSALVFVLCVGALPTSAFARSVVIEKIPYSHNNMETFGDVWSPQLPEYDPTNPSPYYQFMNSVDAPEATSESLGKVEKYAKRDNAECYCKHSDFEIDELGITPCALVEFDHNKIGNGEGLLRLPDDITYIDTGAFKDCEELTAILIPSTVEYVETNAFDNCPNLTTIYCSELTRFAYSASFWQEGDAFNNCPNLKYIYVEGYELNDLSRSPFPDERILYDLNYDYETGKTDPVYKYPYEWETWYSYLDAEVSYSVGYQVVTNSSGRYVISDNGVLWPTFSDNCRFADKLECHVKNTQYISETVIIPDEVKVIPKYCFGFGREGRNDVMKKVKIGKGVEVIDDYAFNYCYALQEIVFSDSLRKIGEGAFINCENLLSVTLPETLQVLCDGVFYNCYRMSYLRLPSSLVKIEDTVVVNQWYNPDDPWALGSFNGSKDMCIEIPDTLDVNSIRIDSFRGSLNIYSTNEADRAADTLNSLGLFGGVGKNENGSINYDLDRAPTRAEAITMLVRLLGAEQEAKEGTWNTPFTDVPEWAEPYVGYAYANGLTSGISATEFGASSEATLPMYLTFVLRAMNYKDGEDFSWDQAQTLAEQLGLTNSSTQSSDFSRGDVAIISLNALTVPQKSSENTLADKLYNDNVLSDNQMEWAGLRN